MAITKERSYYRMCPDSHLIDEARDKPNAELAVALGERLEKVQAELERILHEMGEQIFRLQQEVARNEDAIATMAEEIAYLKEQAA